MVKEPTGVLADGDPYPLGISVGLMTPLRRRRRVTHSRRHGSQFGGSLVIDWVDWLEDPCDRCPVGGDRIDRAARVDGIRQANGRAGLAERVEGFPPFLHRPALL